MLATLFRAHPARDGACLADVPRRLAAPGHDRRRNPAELGAVDIEGNAARHHLDVLLAKTGGGAPVASVGTVIACLQARRELLVFHDISPRLKLTEYVQHFVTQRIPASSLLKS
jgi:hypothetical protein